jgi:hypothetical protein
MDFFYAASVRCSCGNQTLVWNEETGVQYPVHESVPKDGHWYGLIIVHVDGEGYIYGWLRRDYLPAVQFQEFQGVEQ